jgi:hypothetical protein
VTGVHRVVAVHANDAEAGQEANHLAQGARISNAASTKANEPSF